MKKSILTAVLAAALASAAPMLYADDQADLNQSTATLDAAGKTAEGQQRVLQAISTQTGVPVATLTQQKAATGFGFGQLSIANALAQATGKTFDALAADFKSGKGWGVIAKENNVKLGNVVSKVHESAKAAEHAKGGPGGAHGGDHVGAAGHGGGAGHGAGGVHGGGKGK